MTDADLTTRPVRWGILGAGGIASSLAADISRTDGHVVAAVAARDAERAAEFARRYDAPRSFGSYDELWPTTRSTSSTSPPRTRSTGSRPSPRSRRESRCSWRSR